MTLTDLIAAARALELSEYQAAQVKLPSTTTTVKPFTRPNEVGGASRRIILSKEDTRHPDEEPRDKSSFSHSKNGNYCYFCYGNTSHKKGDSRCLRVAS